MNSLIPFAIIFNQALIIRCCGEDVIGDWYINSVPLAPKAFGNLLPSRLPGARLLQSPGFEDGRDGAGGVPKGSRK
jgi:hypothetical protein